ncbi:hypothetical protein AMD00_09720 [Viridibacillus arvi]|uniref:Uncharacterized protein n=1 Tax=Viridibacillus arvi TaxID=263475 RepID=A0A0M0LDB8_9BACL|nr:hypothetical protein AMD00_09720 [Viridibacillus arvi]
MVLIYQYSIPTAYSVRFTKSAYKCKIIDIIVGLLLRNSVFFMEKIMYTLDEKINGYVSTLVQKLIFARFRRTGVEYNE